MRPELRARMARGSRAYAGAAPLESAVAYHEARERASALRDFDAEVEARFWEGCALHGAGRLEASLVEMAPGLTRPEASFRKSDVYRLATRYLRVLAELPADARLVERAVREIEEGVAAHGNAWRSRSRIALARLHVSTGEWRRARALAQEALELRAEDPHGCTWSSYYWLLALITIWVGRVDEAEAVLKDWGRDGTPASQRAFRTWLESHLWRRRGNAAEALPFARRACIESLAGREYPVQVSSAIELARALLSVGRITEGRAAVLDALHWRGSEVGDHAFGARVLPGDWHLARARALAGLTALDADFGATCTGEEPFVTSPAGAARALERARIAYRRLLPRARVLDRRTGTRLRAWQLDTRLASCDRTQAEATTRLLGPGRPAAEAPTRRASSRDSPRGMA